MRPAGREPYQTLLRQQQQLHAEGKGQASKGSPAATLLSGRTLRRAFPQVTPELVDALSEKLLAATDTFLGTDGLARVETPGSSERQPCRSSRRECGRICGHLKTGTGDDLTIAASNADAINAATCATAAGSGTNTTTGSLGNSETPGPGVTRNTATPPGVGLWGYFQFNTSHLAPHRDLILSALPMARHGQLCRALLAAVGSFLGLEGPVPRERLRLLVCHVRWVGQVWHEGWL